MKFVLYTMLALAYGALVMRPSLPMLEYELRKDFIAAELCENQDRPEMECDGKCYLNKRLAEAASEVPDPAETTFAPALPIHLIAKSDLEVPQVYTLEQRGDCYRNRCNKLHLVPPPSPPPMPLV